MNFVVFILNILTNPLIRIKYYESIKYIIVLQNKYTLAQSN